MNTQNYHIRQAFLDTNVFLKVTPRGFLQGDQLLEQLEGRITKRSLVRKLFEDGVLACDSTDGIRSRTTGKFCAECFEPRCHPRLRIHLLHQNVTYVLDLAPTSAANLFDVEDQAKIEGQKLYALDSISY